MRNGKWVYWLIGVYLLGLGYVVHRSTFSETTVRAQSASIRSEAFFSAFDINSTSFNYCDSGAAEPGQVCTTGTAAGDGWLAVPNESTKSVQVEIDALTGTSIEFVIEARLQDATGNAQIWPATGDRSETTTGTFIVQVPDAVYQMRVGVKMTVDTAGAEDITATLNTYSGAR